MSGDESEPRTAGRAVGLFTTSDSRSAPWQAPKIAGLLVYIGLGMLALKPGRPASVRAIAWLAALLTFGHIVAVAVTKNPLGPLAGARDALGSPSQSAGICVPATRDYALHRYICSASA